MGDDRGTGGGTPPKGIGGAGARGPGMAPLLKPGQVIAGQFEVVRLLGRGGMGVVYEVRDHVTGARLGLKTILPVHLANPKAVRRFLEEINAARRLRHPNIVSVFDLGQEKENPSASLFFTMEFLEGQSVRKLIQNRKRLDLEETVRILDPLCAALQYAHRFMVHRDLSPENVMVLEDGRVKLLDFGLARMLDRATMTATGASIGKAHYMSPEQRKSAAHVDKRTDIYALGVMLYEMLAGQLPGGYQRLRDLRPDLPPACDELAAACLVPAERRIASAGEFRRRLKQCLREEGKEPAKSSESAPPTPADPASSPTPAWNFNPPDNPEPVAPAPGTPALKNQGSWQKPLDAPPDTEARGTPFAGDALEEAATPDTPLDFDVKLHQGAVYRTAAPPLSPATSRARGYIIVSSVLGLMLALTTLLGVPSLNVRRSDTPSAAEPPTPPAMPYAPYVEKPAPATTPTLPTPPMPPKTSKTSTQPTVPSFVQRRWNLYDTTANESLKQSVMFNSDGTLSFTVSGGRASKGNWYVTRDNTLYFSATYSMTGEGTATQARYEALTYDGNTMTGKGATKEPHKTYVFRWMATPN